MSVAELLAEGCMSIPEAGKFAGLSRGFLYNAMSKGELPFVIRGDRRLIPKAGLIAYLGRGLIGASARSSRESEPVAVGA